LPAAVGGGVGLVVVVAIRLFHHSAPAAVAAPPEAKPASEFDPFVQGSASEQRGAHRRTGNPVEVHIRLPKAEQPQLHGYVMDRSTGGLCLRVDQPVQPGTMLHVRPVNAPPITPWVEIEVKSSRQTQDGWELGCQFLRTPPWALLLMFG
jgi:hypothetical protein